MEDLCEALDQTVLDIFQILEDLYNAKEKLEEAMRDGYFQMSRSRYSIGVKRVNADQILDADISCTRSVSLLMSSDELSNQCSKDQNPDDPNNKLKAFELECKQYASREKKKNPESNTDNEKVRGTELRQRGTKTSEEKDAAESGGKSSGSTARKSTSDEAVEEESKGSKFVLTNPINLFGVLVPQTLRSSQKSFETAVSLTVDIANLQIQLSSLQKKYLSLKEKKKNLLSEKEA